MKFIDVLVTKTRDGSTNISVSEVVFRTRTTDHSPRIIFSEQKEFEIPPREKDIFGSVGAVKIEIADVTLTATTIPEQNGYIYVRCPESDQYETVTVGQSELIMIGEGNFVIDSGKFREEEFGIHVHNHTVYESLIRMIETDTEGPSADLIIDFLKHSFICTDADVIEKIRKNSKLSMTIHDSRSEVLYLIESLGELFLVGDDFPRKNQYLSLAINIWRVANETLKPELEK